MSTHALLPTVATTTREQSLFGDWRYVVVALWRGAGPVVLSRKSGEDRHNWGTMMYIAE